MTNSVNALPGQFETSGAVLNAMMRNDLIAGRTIITRLLGAATAAMTAATLDTAIRDGDRPKGFTWVVVGDAAKLKPQLEKLGMPVEVIEARRVDGGRWTRPTARAIGVPCSDSTEWLARRLAFHASKLNPRANLRTSLAHARFMGGTGHRGHHSPGFNPAVGAAS